MTGFRTALRRVKMKGGAEVRLLHPMNPADIGQQLRRTADEIDRGELVCDTMVAVLNTDEGVNVYGWGKIDGARATAQERRRSFRSARTSFTALSSTTRG